MKKKKISILVATALLAVSQITLAADVVKTKKPLKIYILAGQSNMQGKGALSTLPRMALSPESKPLYDKLVDENGKPRVHKNVSIVYFTLGDVKAGVTRPLREQKGLLAAGVDGGIGPAIAFGITMEEANDEPILIIKTAWGGKSLYKNFRPPSAGPLETEEKGSTKTDEDSQGAHYRLMMKLIKMVLADPGKYCEAYDSKQGYEIAGFGWFQGFNDMAAGKTDLYKATADKPAFAAYTDLLACFIRDVRKELNAPKMPFVIGVMGIGGVQKDSPLRKAQAATAALPEFKGNVAAVETAGFWDNEMVAALERVSKAKALFDASKDWIAVGTPLPQDRICHYTSFELAPEKQYRDLEEDEEGDTRTLTGETPAQLKDWLNPSFDTSKWQKGPAPITKGTKPAKSKGGKKKKGQDEQKEKPDTRVGSPWGEGNMLLMKTTFTIERAEFTDFRLCIHSSGSYRVYLNGQLIKDYPWWSSKDEIHRGNINAEFVKQGVNELAFYGNIMTNKKVDTFNAVDMYLEGLPKAKGEAIRKQQDGIASARDRELVKGKSNQEFHYLGSAYTYSRIGDAMAKAMIQLEKAH